MEEPCVRFGQSYESNGLEADWCIGVLRPSHFANGKLGRRGTHDKNH
jgi:hypothetical protein